MGPPPDPEQLAQAMNNPLFQGTMNEMLRNPQLLDYIIASNPMLQQLGPEARRLMQSDMFRQMMTNPDVIRQMSQMGGTLGGRGFGGMGGVGGGAPPSFPEPGRTDTTPTPSGETHTGSDSTASPPPQNPFGAPGGTPNPFAALFGAPPVGSPPAAGAPQNPFGLNPAMLSMLGNMNAAGAPPGGGQAPPPVFDPATMNALLGAMGQPGGLGAVSPPTPVDNRLPEERYAEQLRQLNDMGFFDFDRNVEALRRSGGSVQGAINQLLGG